MLRLCTSRSGNQHDERSDLRARQNETTALKSIQEHRECNEEGEEHPVPCSPNQHHILSALTYASETWAFCKKENNAINVIELGIERGVRSIPLYASKRGDFYFTDRRSEMLPHTQGKQN
ncbi:hypothetical protein RB195_017509 [Necator americanus]|uniref:Uncharacterized protein n=1 Tax=Necator americanus TaxID=51031 RepID=A0ABR1C8K8_NECAM